MHDLKENLSKENENRKTYLDCLRIIAIFMVLYNHTSTRGYVLFTVARKSPLYWFYLFFSIFIKIAVPVFFMISGALLLSKKETVWKVIRKRVTRIVAALVLCSAIGYLYTMRLDFSKMSLAYFFKILYSSRHTTASWYLYSYLAFLVVLPLLQSFAKSLDFKQYLYMIGIFMAFQCLGIAEYVLGGVFRIMAILRFLWLRKMYFTPWLDIFWKNGCFQNFIHGRIAVI